MNKIIDLVITFIKSFFYAVSHSCFKKKHKSTHHKAREPENTEHARRKRKTSITETTTKTTEITFEGFGNSSSSPDTDKETNK